MQLKTTRTKYRHQGDQEYIDHIPLGFLLQETLWIQTCDIHFHFYDWFFEWATLLLMHIRDSYVSAIDVCNYVPHQDYTPWYCSYTCIMRSKDICWIYFFPNNKMPECEPWSCCIVLLSSKFSLPAYCFKFLCSPILSVEKNLKFFVYYFAPIINKHN